MTAKNGPVTPGRVPNRLDRREIVARVRHLTTSIPENRRLVLGITGPPGAGKSTLAASLAETFGSHVALAPMDGFHFSNELLKTWGRQGRKGAPDTFDVDGYADMLRRVKHRGRVIYVPRFDRDLEASIGSALAIPPDAKLVITEGNYLLHEGDGWDQIRSLLDETWYLDISRDEAERRLFRRRVGHGHPEPEAHKWVSQVDLANYDAVCESKIRADLIVPALS